MLDRKKFYDKIRTSGMFPILKQSQVDGIDSIFNEWDLRPDLKDVRMLAYMLATAYHETASTMQPIKEYGRGAGRPYGKKIKMSGLKYTKPDKIYFGRGLVQLTWYENYELMGRLLCVDLLEHPELAETVNLAVRIMFEGMLRGSSSFGDFTGKCLEQYFNKTTDDPKNARRIINGIDKAALIVTYHNKFLSGLI